LEILPEDCSLLQFLKILQRPGLRSIVVQDPEHASDLSKYYKSGGLIVFFGFHGVITHPTQLSRMFGLDWKFNTYKSHKDELTDCGKSILGDAISGVGYYTGSNVLCVPLQDRILVPKQRYETLYIFILNCCDYDLDDEDSATKGQIEYDK
jgi:hypothetical protein